MPTLPRHRKLTWEGNTNKPKNNIHHTNRWKRTSETKRRINPLCELCIKEDKVTVATQVDHIIPLDQGGDPFVMNNLQSICNYHHNEKNKAENRRRGGG